MAQFLTVLLFAGIKPRSILQFVASARGTDKRSSGRHQQPTLSPTPILGTPVE